MPIKSMQYVPMAQFKWWYEAMGYMRVHQERDYPVWYWRTSKRGEWNVCERMYIPKETRRKIAESNIGYKK